MADVAPSCGDTKSRLGTRRARPPERVNDGQLQALREGIRLVEAAAEATPGMEWHRDDAVGVPQEEAAVGAHERGKRIGQRPAIVVLERVKNRPQRAVVVARGAGAIERRRYSPAARAHTLRLGEDTP